MIIVGSDPGKKGALVSLDTESNRCAKLDLKYDYQNFLDSGAVNVFLAFENPDLILLEKVGGRGGWGATQLFNFGDVYGQIRLCLRSSGRPLRFVTPREWQGVIHAGMPYNLDAKKRTKQSLANWFPTLPKVREDVGDALALAFYGVMKYGRSNRNDWDFTHLQSSKVSRVKPGRKCPEKPC